VNVQQWFLKLFSTTSHLTDFKYAAKTNVSVGKFNDQTFHVVECLRARDILEIN